MNSREELKKLGGNIRHLRETKGLTQEDFAKQCHLSKNYIGMLERGERNPSYLTLTQISSLLKVSLRDLV